MYGPCTPRPVISGQPQQHKTAGPKCSDPMANQHGNATTRLSSGCFASARSPDLDPETSLPYNADDHSSRMQWSQRFRPRTATRLNAPDVSKQPHQPKLSLAREPLRKVLASAGIDSYHKCRSIVLGGHVTVNGVLVRHPQRHVDPREDRIVVKGRLLEPARIHVFWLLHKPSGVMCNLSPVANSNFTSLVDILRSIVPENLNHFNDRLHIVWRLGLHSSGMQLVTSDPDWARQVMDNTHVDQEFLVTVASIPSKAQLASLRAGEGHNAIPPRSVKLGQVHRNGTQSRWLITMNTGRCSDVITLVSHAGLRCLHVKRTRIGGLILPNDVPPGKGCCLQAQQVQQVSDAAASRSAGLNCASEIFGQSDSGFRMTMRV